MACVDRPGERGAATVLVVAMVAVVLVVGVAVAAATGLLVAHRRAQAAADLAALAAAVAWRRGDDPCAAAEHVAAGNGARLTRCDRLGADVVVRVAVRAPGDPPWPAELVGAARAGPDRSAG